MSFNLLEACITKDCAYIVCEYLMKRKKEYKRAYNKKVVLPIKCLSKVRKEKAIDNVGEKGLQFHSRDRINYLFKNGIFFKGFTSLELAIRMLTDDKDDERYHRILREFGGHLRVCTYAKDEDLQRTIGIELYDLDI